jgi:hypothetical protein
MVLLVYFALLFGTVQEYSRFYLDGKKAARLFLAEPFSYGSFFRPIRRKRSNINVASFVEVNVMSQQLGGRQNKTTERKLPIAAPPTPCSGDCLCLPDVVVVAVRGWHFYPSY